MNENEKYNLTDNFFPGSREEKEKLRKYKSIIDNAIGNVKNYVFKIIDILTLINNEELYFYDKCKTIQQFIIKNEYDKKLLSSKESIVRKIHSIGFMYKMGFDTDEIKEIPLLKARIISEKGVSNKEEFNSLVKLSCKELNKVIRTEYERQPTKNPIGEPILSKEIIKKYIFKVLRKNEEDFETDIFEVMRKHNAKVIDLN